MRPPRSAAEYALPVRVSEGWNGNRVTRPRGRATGGGRQPMVKKVDVKTVTNGEGGGPTSEWHVFYDISASVGRGKSGDVLVNYRDDVMLIQYMLRKYYKRGSFKLEPLGHLAVDGIFGPMTDYWMTYLYTYKTLETLFNDEDMGTVKNEYGKYVPLSKHPGIFGGEYRKSMMYKLNVGMWKIHRKDVDKLDKIDPEMPAELRAALQRA
jgi:hypothetical protein